MDPYFSDQVAPLRAVQVEFYRLPRHRWASVLTRVHQMGADTVSAGLYWGWHEVEDGRFDLTGVTDGRRDAVGFVALCARMGLRVILRPGPFIGTQVLGGGVPSWLLHRRPELYALHVDGTPWRCPDSGAPRCSYTHPLYVEYVRRWYARTAEAFLSAQWPAGPIIALQVDHEISSGEAPPGERTSSLNPLDMIDHNPHVTRTLWPVWLRKRYQSIAALNSAYGTSHATFSDVPLPGELPGSPAARRVRVCLDVSQFADWCLAYALQTYTKLLRTAGWTVPVFHDLAPSRWMRVGQLPSISALAEVCPWLGHNLSAHLQRDGHEVALDFAQYVHDAHWRTKLLASYAPHQPSLLSKVSAADSFALQATYAGGLEAAVVSPGVQADPDPPDVGTSIRWGTGAPIRPNGFLRPCFWHTKALFTYLAAGGAELAKSRTEARVALGHVHPIFCAGGLGSDTNSLHELTQESSEGPRRETEAAASRLASQHVAQQLVRLQVPFDVLDLVRAPHDQLAGYPLLLVPIEERMPRQAQHKLLAYAQGGGDLVLIGQRWPVYDEWLEPCRVLADEVGDGVRLLSVEAVQALDPAGWQDLCIPADVGERPVWTDASQVDVSIRYATGSNGGGASAASTVFLVAVNRGPETFEGTVHYVDAGGRRREVAMSLGSLRVGFATVRDDQVVSAVLQGRRGGSTSTARGGFSFDRGSGVVATSEDGLVLSAAGPGTFRLERDRGWEGIVAYRLLLDGRLLPHPAQTEGTSLVVDYPAQDPLGITDSILLLDPAYPLQGEARRYLLTLLACRRAVLAEAAATAEQLAAELRDLEMRARVVPSEGAPRAPLGDALSKAIRSVDRAARYARDLRQVVEGQAEAQDEPSRRSQVWMTQDVRAHLTSLGQAVGQALIALANAAERCTLPGEPHGIDAYQSRVDELASAIMPIRQCLQVELARLRGDLQARDIEPQAGALVEGSLADLLGTLLDLE